MEIADKKLTVLLLRLHCYFVEEAGYDDVLPQIQRQEDLAIG